MQSEVEWEEKENLYV